MTTATATRNPFGEMDVPNADDDEVRAFAARTVIAGRADDDNAKAWGAADGRRDGTVEGAWVSRWNGGADPTIPGDAETKWKQGRAEARFAGERLYLRFDWSNGARKAMIDARREGARLTGRYINLSSPEITRPWVGLIVSDDRIDGQWTGGRLDFRR